MSAGELEERIERKTRPEPDYEGKRFEADAVADGSHRRFVGGHWDEIGELQQRFLEKSGLKPKHRFLDVGCGSLRAGVRLVDYLRPGNYYGIDINPDLIRIGYEKELSSAQRERLPLSNLHSTDRFDADFGVRIDMAIAQSVFSHISLNMIRLCLFRVAKVMKRGGRLYATFNEQERGFPLDAVPKKGQYTEHNVYWYYREDLRWAAQFSPWRFRYIGDWGHPRGQRMVEFTRR